MRRLRLGLLLGAAQLIGCGDGPTAARPTLDVAITGMAERGATVGLELRRDGVAFVPATLTVDVEPADAVTVTGSSLLLLRAGTFPLRVIADGDTARATLTVVAPPRIVFDAVVGGNRDIYSVALDGQELQRVTTNAADDAQPTAAGGTIIFSSRRDGNAELYAIAPDGSGERRLSNSPAVNEILPALSADGRLLAFVKDSAHVTRVWVSPPDLTGASPATPPTTAVTGALESSPSWGASDFLVVFATTATPSGNSGIVMHVTPGGGTTLIRDSGSQRAEVEPSLSPDGLSVALASGNGSVSGVYTRDLSGAISTMYEASASVGQPAFLLDRRIAFTRFTLTGSSLAWVDPRTPLVVHDIALPGLLSPQHPQPLRP